MRHDKSSGIPVWVWILLGVGGFAFMSVGIVCAGMLWMGKKAGEVQEAVEKSEQAERKQDQKPQPTQRHVQQLAFGESVAFGPLTVQVKTARLAHYQGRSPAKSVISSSQPGIVSTIVITTTDGTKEHTAKGATGTASLTDDLGNTISAMRLKTDLGFTCDIDGQLKGGGVYTVRSDKPLSDTLVFDQPVPAASTLTLTLDATNYGGTGNLVVTLPESIWKPKKR